nr:hydrogenase formation protein HypD [Desulfobulbaceae bacterium]
MEWIQAFRNTDAALTLAKKLHSLNLHPIRLMEVCGTHTMAIAQNGIRELMPPAITLTSGPGCPVCVTAVQEIDTFVAASRIDNTIITTFGDLIKVPGSTSSLIKEMGTKAVVKIVYSALDALDIARKNPDKEIIFLGVGFETTTPTIAAAILQAAASNIDNFSVISAHKLMPPALQALASDPEVHINGLLCPGHVSIMIGAAAYLPFVKKYNIPCVIAGFEAVDILHGIVMLAQQCINNEPAKVEISYQRAVYEKGNSKAMAIMYQVFEPCSAEWRGIGTIDDSGLKIRSEFEKFDSVKKFNLPQVKGKDTPGCQCGKVLKGIFMPPDCKLFKKACRPDHPVGPCMVSSEGSCAAYYRYHK